MFIDGVAIIVAPCGRDGDVDDDETKNSHDFHKVLSWPRSILGWSYQPREKVVTIRIGPVKQVILVVSEFEEMSFDKISLQGVQGAVVNGETGLFQDLSPEMVEVESSPDDAGAAWVSDLAGFGDQPAVFFVEVHHIVPPLPHSGVVGPLSANVELDGGIIQGQYGHTRHDFGLECQNQLVEGESVFLNLGIAEVERGGHITVHGPIEMVVPFGVRVSRAGPDESNAFDAPFPLPLDSRYFRFSRGIGASGSRRVGEAVPHPDGTVDAVDVRSDGNFEGVAVPIMDGFGGYDFHDVLARSSP